MLALSPGVSTSNRWNYAMSRSLQSCRLHVAPGVRRTRTPGGGNPWRARGAESRTIQRGSEGLCRKPTALRLRAMNMRYEGLKERGALIIVPSPALDSVDLGGIGGLAALCKA